MTKKKTRKSHYIPQFYLKYFADCDPEGKNCKLWIYDNKTSKIFNRGPGGIFWKEYFYALESGKRDALGQEVEDLFSIHEGVQKTVFDEIASKIFNDQEISNLLLNDFIDGAISIFVRTKTFKKDADFQRKYIISDMLKTAEESNAESINDTSLEDIREMLNTPEEDNKEFFRSAVQYRKTLDILKIKKITFYVIPETSIHSFFIGNQPFFDIFIDNPMTLLSNHVLLREQFFVLHPKILVKFECPFGERKIPEDTVSQMKMLNDMKVGADFERYEKVVISEDYEIMSLNNVISLRQGELLIHKNKEYIEKFFTWIEITKKILEKYQPTGGSSKKSK